MITLTTKQDRQFGQLIGITLLILSGLSIIKHHHIVALSILFISTGLLFILIGTFRPVRLRPLNYVWMLVGEGLHCIVSPIVMAMLFITIIIPAGLIRRISNNNHTNTKFDATSQSYWISKKPIEPDSIKHQF